MSTSSDIVAQFDSITSVSESSQLQLLQATYGRLSPQMVTPEEYLAILRLFERFPDDDAHEGFWPLLHLLEKCRQFEPLLVESVRRSPTLMTVSMVDRLLSGGFASVGVQDLRKLLLDSLHNSNMSVGNRAVAEQSILRHAIPN